MKNFDLLSKTEILKKFPYQGDTELYIHNIGFNNFEYIEPIKMVHRQLGYTLHFVLAGEGTLFLNGKEFNICEKQFFFLPPNQEQMYYPREINKWKYVWFYFSGNRAEEIGKKLGFSCENPVLNLKNFKDIEAEILSLMRDAELGTVNEYKAKGAFYTIIGELIGNETSEALAQSCVEEASGFIETNFSNCDFSVETLCRILYISHSALCKAFRTKLGTTPQKYLIDIRMRNAAKLLFDKNISVRNVAKCSGYKDEIHFMKTFKRYYGVTATEYRHRAIKSKDEQKQMS